MSNVPTRDGISFLTNKPLPPEQQRLFSDYQQRTPIAEVHVTMFGLDQGQAVVHVQSSPTGELAALNATGAGRADAYARLLASLQRELQQALTTLGSH